MKLKLKLVLFSLLLPLLLISSFGFSGCKGTNPNLAAGGVYAPTNQPPQQGLFIADEAYKLAYQTVQSVFAFEKTNRVMIQNISPAIKTALDKARPIAVDVDQRWAKARSVYQQAPTPDGLTTIQGILQEIQILVPVVQDAISPVYSTLKK